MSGMRGLGKLVHRLVNLAELVLGRRLMTEALTPVGCRGHAQSPG